MGVRVREDADAKGLDYGEFIARIVSDHYGLPYENPVALRGVNSSSQQELPMTG